MLKNIDFDIIILILLFHITLIELSYLSFFNYLKYGIILVIGIYILVHIKLIFKKKFTFINLLFGCYGISVIISSFFNRGIVERDTFLASLIYSAIILETLFTLEIILEKQKITSLIKTFFISMFVYVILNDVLFIVTPELFKIIGGTYYLIGNKFHASYSHLILITLFLLQNNNKKIFNFKIKLILMFCVSFLIVSLMDCQTGIVGLVLLFVLILLSHKKSIVNRTNILVIFTLSFSFVFLYQFVTENVLVEFLLTNILDTSLTLTNRTTIYSKLLLIMENHYLLGYGYGSSYEYLIESIGAPNVQNGLFDIIFQSGIFATFFFVLIIFFGTRKMNVVKNNRYLNCLFMVFVILSSIEIIYKFKFFMILSLLIVLNIDNVIFNRNSNIRFH